MRLIYHEGAFTDMRDAVDYYTMQSARAARRLKAAIKRSLKSIEADVARFPIIEGKIRRCRVPGFPFDLYFADLGDCVRIYALCHHSREPEYWKHRLDS
jgi:plasmid stabilization system protein ParE